MGSPVALMKYNRNVIALKQDIFQGGIRKNCLQTYVKAVYVFRIDGYFFL
jgi:hypothetical protein